MGRRSIDTVDNAPKVGGEAVVGSQVAHAIKAVGRWWLEAFGTSANAPRRRWKPSSTSDNVPKGGGGGGCQLAHLG